MALHQRGRFAEQVFPVMFLARDSFSITSAKEEFSSVRSKASILDLNNSSGYLINVGLLAVFADSNTHDRYSAEIDEIAIRI